MKKPRSRRQKINDTHREIRRLMREKDKLNRRFAGGAYNKRNGARPPTVGKRNKKAVEGNRDRRPEVGEIDNKDPEQKEQDPGDLRS